ncbi:phospholipase D-like domain-containing protein [Sphingomonas sp. Leaf25]|uniref:phospholipase D-like domain-containing protein n=1 Tax=Sphingomonas sp. Leaf25 TaxID=1735692 RepID=UPI0006FCF0CB|nr:phospholipase D-like domain-containing protein [Sphingomonas sp. Leaf25]KQM97648.1 phospholipase [Sphingomonas sp. Leaf25]
MALHTPPLDPNRNCWRIEQATRATVLVDADNYFAAARAAMLKARKQILLIGWDFDARIRFKTDPASEGPEKVGEFISWLVRRTPGLQVHILRWDTGAIKTLFHGRTLLRLAKWIKDPQVHLRLDGHHPVAGSHHQKVVVIDDDVAFCGGIDMTVDRWDTREHIDDDPRRIEPDGTPYKPWHDVTTALEGPIAAALGDMCRARWQVSGGEELPRPTDAGGCWPDGLEPDFTDVEVAIARTIPEMAEQVPVHEIEALYLDLIARAERFIYAESQYFASRKVAEAIARRLDEADGPEVVIVNPTTAEGWLEPIAMDSARARIFQALKERDRHDRLRLYHPFTAGGTAIYVHAKVTVIDDQLLRVGSSNFNNRSLRLDTECDVTIDATRSANADERSTIAGIRDSLLAEHLDVTCQVVQDTLACTNSLIATIEELRGDGRSLRPYEIPDLNGVMEWLADNKVLDPEGPEEMFEAFSTRKPLLRRLAKHRPHLHRADDTLSPVVTAVAVGGVVAGGTLVGMMLWQAWRRRDTGQPS